MNYSEILFACVIQVVEKIFNIFSMQIFSIIMTIIFGVILLCVKRLISHKVLQNYQQAIQLSETPVFCNTQHIFGISLSIFSSRRILGILAIDPPDLQASRRHNHLTNVNGAAIVYRAAGNSSVSCVLCLTSETIELIE
ncbi:unnamed protein product [Acanthoscelides obtectus]|uniref:Uncharacterized protein n=1 Tax=Acanthoscelides obtectus TaxID=200917 RepID=A0A9P0NUL6_ACAOB|nr:unnamed protein product [Acanthoscelides obtectus]CAK1673759.1 hypothetical protein AOBTE_LOCUS29430 [Acanthoscelides obtectus]